MVISQEDWTKKIVDIYGDRGKNWLHSLPETIAYCANKWDFSILPPFENLSYNYVAAGTKIDSTPIVLKAGVPSMEFTQEIQALQIFDGNGIVRLLDCDTEMGVMLLERLVPGSHLSSIPDDEVLTLVAAEVMQTLWKPSPVNHNFRSVQSWADGLNKIQILFKGGYGPFPKKIVVLAIELFIEIQSSTKDTLLIHGDFHPGNILSAHRAPWLAIDPKGVIGNPMFDVATFACSSSKPHHNSNRNQFFIRCIDQLVELLQLDKKIILKWCLAYSVLSGWWNFEDHGSGWELEFDRARFIKTLL